MKKTSKKKRSWRDVPDEVLLCLLPQELPRAESLCPSASTVERSAFGDPRAMAITEAWAFTLPVIEMV